MARNNRKGKGAGPTFRSMRQKKEYLLIKENNRKRNLLHTLAKRDSMK
jgi:hypothetical protein